MIGPAEIEEMMAEYAEAHGGAVDKESRSLLWPVLSAEAATHPADETRAPGSPDDLWVSVQAIAAAR